ncbi:PREDICTED: uncharacterized protein LOC100635853 [Amphimedon queenslandica]|uniref:Uncharacterized protein n=1 Tax=Amphimedon queenslandica TaxID=400682 RepID=A0A1X7VEN4_AMPQE|nr:PREDICTED: uncharacterized protein LOC100635853 [Amphimedon queenslandica]|eukprot:XP_003384522.1 PREDICTED: uncharacterized protein LOC100635853 [Amphimedon queenslandica]
MSCDDCCKRCCYSTPFYALFALIMMSIGAIGFVVSAVYGIVTISTTSVLSQNVVIFAPVIGGIIILTIFPILFSTIMSYCVTGYIRDELFASIVKKFIGPVCSFCSVGLNLMCLCFWLLLTVALSALLTVSVQLRLACNEESIECLPSTNYTFINQVCGSDLAELCDKGNDAGVAFVVTLIFTLIIIFAMVLTLMIQSANYVNARENMEYRRSYQPRNVPNSSEYAMKNVH